jgi:hypothetical protein
MWRCISKPVAHAVINTVVVLALIGCNNPLDSNSTAQRQSKSEQELIFDSGLGAGQYDKMTYMEFQSEITLTPKADMTVSGIRPHIWYCSGTSGFLAFVRDAHYQPVAAEAGLVDGTGDMTPTFSDRHFEKTVTLKAGVSYLIQLKVWTTKSVGIYTTGDRTEGTIGSADYVVQSAASNTADHLDRGGIAFQLVQ